ncbi:MAG: response regulator, partial [Pseudomonadota bacterium]
MISNDDILGAAILIVDDQAVNVQLLEYLLLNTGYTNVSSTTDPFAVAGLHQHQRFDLIILDLHMPGMDGFEVMRALKPMETETWLPVLVVTADPDKNVEALKAGARDFVPKPFDPVEILTRIRNLLEMRLMHRETRNYGVLLERTVQQRTGELQRFRSAMDATADAIFLIDTASMELADVNDGACRMLGYRREALLMRRPSEIGLASDEQLERHARRTRIGSQEPELIETELIRADLIGVPVETYWHLQTVGQAGTLIAVARDISERRLAQQRMRHLASYDSLTGLPNRTLFYQTLGEAI